MKHFEMRFGLAPYQKRGIECDRIFVNSG